MCKDSHEYVYHANFVQGTLGQVEHEMRKSTLVIIGLLLLCCTLFAAPAKRGVVIMTQPDGTTFQALLKGDEFVKVKTTLQGQAIVQEEDGWWCYAAFAPDGSRHSTGFRVGSETPVSVMQESQNIPFNALASAASLTRQQSRQVENHLQTRAGQGTQATKHVLVILVEYSDVKFTYGKSSFENLLINKGYSCGSFGADGQFGAATEKAVVQFQKDHNLTADGIIGAKTWAALDSTEPATKYTVTIPHLSTSQAEALLRQYPDATKTEERG